MRPPRETGRDALFFCHPSNPFEGCRVAPVMPLGESHMSDRIAGRPVNRVSSETRIVDGRTVGRMYTKWVSDLSHEDLEKCEAFGVKMMAAMHAKLRRRREALGRTLTREE